MFHGVLCYQFSNFERIPSHGIAHNVVPRFANSTKVSHHSGVHGKHVRIFSITKVSMRGGRRWHEFLHEGFYFMGFGVEGPFKSSFIISLWLMVLGFKGWGS